MMEIVPFISVGNLAFSDGREILRKKLDQEFEAGVKEFGNIKDHYDLFEESDLMVVYDEYDHINAFEFYKGNIKFEEKDLLAMSYQDLVNLFSDLDPDLTIGYNDFSSNKYGIGGHTSDDPEDESALPTAVIIFRKGYYDQLDI